MISRENLILLIEQICKPNLKLTIKNSLSLNFQINFIPEYKLLSILGSKRTKHI